MLPLSSAPDDSLPLTQRQALLWLDSQLEPESPWHNLVLAIEIEGPLDRKRLSQAWHATVWGCDALRMAIHAQQPRQHLVDLVPELLMLDVAPAELQTWIAGRCVRPLPLDRPPWDAALLCLGSQRHVFYLCQKHLITDGISMLLVAEDLAERYAGRTPARGATFVDYLQDEAAYQRSPKAERDQAHHRANLPGPVPALRLYGLARMLGTSGLARIEQDAGIELAQRLAELATRAPFVCMTPALSRLAVIATGLAAYLHRSSGQREILLGVPVANRSARFANTCGLLMEQMFVRVEVEPGDSFVALGARVHKQLLEGVRHGRACISDRGLSYVTLNMIPQLSTRFADLPARTILRPAQTISSATGAAPRDQRDTLGLQVHDFAEGPLRFAFDFHADTFDPATRSRALAHWRRVLDALAAEPGGRIDDVDVLPPEERALVLAAARGPEPDGEAPDLIDCLRQHAQVSPGRLALDAPEGQLSYAELDQKTEALAGRLAALGVGPGTAVGVALPRGARELVALLGILKAGGAYVPLDAGHPLDRIRLIVEDAAPAVVVAASDSPLLPALPVTARVLTLDDLALLTAAEVAPGLPIRGDESGTRPLEPVAGGGKSSSGGATRIDGQLAYLLFTSGSTGRPKGVEISRAALASFLRSMARAPGLRPDDRLLAITTTSFDIAGLELFLPLWVGGCVVIADRDTATDPRRLRERLESERFTVLQATPATWRLLLAAGWHPHPGLRMLCGGEALSPDLARQLTHGGELWNLYGPTETTVWSSAELIPPGFDRITIGRPIDHTLLYVLDGRHRLCPLGVSGELSIGGRGLACGYHGRPELTAERFVPDPHGPPGARIYRTGDLGRLLPDGRFECLGRDDFQVKVRGFRIELGEIESALRKVPGAIEVLVTAEKPGPEHEPVLCAYWVGVATRDDLLRQARASLPPYMVPSAYVSLTAFPLNSNGKIDRKALPHPEAGTSTTRTLQAPRTIEEERMAAIWSDILGVAPIGVDQDFFDLGGTSVKAIEARVRIEQAFGLSLSLRTFFAAPTIEHLVRQLGVKDDSSEPIVMRLRQGPADLPPLHCLLGIELYQDLALALPTSRTVYGIHIPFLYQPGGDHMPAITEIAARYRGAICAGQKSGPYHLAGLCFGGVIAYEVGRQLEAAGEVVGSVALIDSTLPDAVTIDWRLRLGMAVRRAVHEPRTMLRYLGERGLRWLQDSKTQMPADKVDLQVDSPEATAAVRRYQPLAFGLRAPLQVFRATGRRVSWYRAPDHLGWAGRSSRVSVHTIASDHLAIVRRPHVDGIAEALQWAMAASDGSPRSSG